MKDPRVEKPKSRPQESKAPARQRSDSFETSKQAQKEKKKNDKQHWDQKPQKGSTPATRGKNTSAKRSQAHKNVSQVTCFNCNKKDTIQASVPSPLSQKTSIGLGNLRVGDWG